ncbi:hypothetical protein [Caulobacter sp. RL271]|jgi:hypothetical protein|uniref:Uncharacterized protein n=1 Tax=Caulobacter segnis TaxID=88688 RepID=A0ABY4ZYV8_9CAUL|nr:hypothetical protein [Caulobacter segnis]USQ97554.1 hypothetical protein MZV50_08465 [Caulobacter segnis]
MADGHFQDVELLRRELAILVLEWAGKSVKDDPDGPMSTALTRAVGEAARDAVAEQHQVLSAEAADRIAEALDRRARAEGLMVWRLRPWTLGVIALAAAALLALAFVLGLQTGRGEPAPPPETATTAAPIAPLAPTVEAPSPRPAASEPAQQPAPRAQKPPARAPAPAARAAPRELGRPAAATDEAAPRSTQPVGAANATTPSSTPTTVPKP